MQKPKVKIGWREYIDLPGLGISHVPAKIDTGARSSALHVDSVKPFEADDGRQMLRIAFRIRDENKGKPVRLQRDIPAAGQRKVRSSNGSYEMRWVIRTKLVLGGISRISEFTLTNRGSMRFPALVGRSALRRSFEIDPGKSYLHGNREAEPLVHSGDIP